ncbi:unnamed protein product [Coccothraustes coccothraustes]
MVGGGLRRRAFPVELRASSWRRPRLRTRLSVLWERGDGPRPRRLSQCLCPRRSGAAVGAVAGPEEVPPSRDESFGFVPAPVLPRAVGTVAERREREGAEPAAAPLPAQRERRGRAGGCPAASPEREKGPSRRLPRCQPREREGAEPAAAPLPAQRERRGRAGGCPAASPEREKGPSRRLPRCQPREREGAEPAEVRRRGDAAGVSRRGPASVGSVKGGAAPPGAGAAGEAAAPRPFSTRP